MRVFRPDTLIATLLLPLSLLATLGVSGSAWAQMVEDQHRLATDSAVTHLFPLNPAVLKPKALQGGLMVTRHQRQASLDHIEEAGDKVTTSTTEEAVVAAAVADLGAGAGIAATHQLLFRKSETELQSDGRGTPREELGKIQHSSIRLIVELTTEIKAGIAMRYLYKDISILGDPFLGELEKTRYKTTLVGYGAGFSYAVKSFGASYTYFPPLRGKTDVEGEEKIIVEPGLLSLDGFYRANEQWTVGLLAQRWLNEVDDLAEGTTAADDETNISLYGLDPDQYVKPQQLIMLGFDFVASPMVTAKLSIGQEKALFNFDDYLVYNRADVRGRGDEPTMKYNRIRAAVSFTLKAGVTADLGLGLYRREYDFPSTMNGGSYEGDGREMFATLGAGL